MDLTYFIAIWFFGILAGFASYTAGNEVILGGNLAAVDQFPYHVSIHRNNGKPICGGGVIGDKFILTSAHCFLDEAGQFEDKNYISVLAGTNDFKKTGKPAEVIKVQKIYVPKKYIYYTVDRRRFDVAVLKLELPLKLTDYVVRKSKHIRKLELPKHENEIYDGKTAVIAGFGWNWAKINNSEHHGGWTDSHLRFANVDVFSKEQCADAYKLEQLVDPYLCARIKHQDESKTYSTCFGDSGGPLVYENTVIGVLSSAPICLTEKIRPSIYIGTVHFLDFIADARKDKTTEEILVYEVKH